MTAAAGLGLRGLVIEALGERHLLELAGWWRGFARRTTVVGITGSVGKTTVKELLVAILRTRGPTHCNYGSVNSGQWLARAVLGIRPWHRYAVIEMSGSKPGRMQQAARVVRPNIAVVTKIARTHTRSLPTLDEAAASKASLLDRLAPGGVAVLNGDDPRVAAMAERVAGPGQRVMLFGTSPGLDLRASNVTARWPERLAFTVEHHGTRATVATQLVGAHWLPSALATIAAAMACGVPLDEAAAALRDLQPYTARLQPVRLPSGAVMLRDDFNGSVDSLEVALEVLATASGVRRVLMISDITDLGTNFRHRFRHLASLLPGAADFVVFTGEHAAYGARRLLEAGFPSSAVRAIEDLREATRFATEELRDGDLVLLRGRTTDHISRVFLAQFGEVTCWRSSCDFLCICDDCPLLRAEPGPRYSIRRLYEKVSRSAQSLERKPSAQQGHGG